MIDEVKIFRRALSGKGEGREPGVASLRPVRADTPESRRPLSLGPARRDD